MLVALIVVTGAAVRLTGSGLGCSDWPECSVGHLTPALQFHGLVEFGNRLVTVVLTVAVAAAFLGAVFRSPRRRDLVWLSGGLVAGVLAQAVLGGIVVYTKLNPYVVMVHFVATILLVADAVVLVHRDRLDYSPGSARLLVPRPVIRGFYGLLALLALVITAGTATTGAGPHAGDASGQQVARRIPVALRDMAELHSSLALLHGGPDRRARRGAARLRRRPVSGAAIGADPPRDHGGAGSDRLHAVLHAPARVVGRVASRRGDRVGDRCAPDLPRLHLSPAGAGGAGRTGGVAGARGGCGSGRGRLRCAVVGRWQAGRQVGGHGFAGNGVADLGRGPGSEPGGRGNGADRRALLGSDSPLTTSGRAPIV